MSTIAAEAPALSFDIERQRSLIADVLAKKSFCTLATSSAGGYPHVAGVLFKEVDGDLYLHVHDDSVKARNVLANSRVAVLIPVRKIPVGPPYVVHFQGTAEVIPHADPRIQALEAAGRFGKLVPKGAGEDPRSAFIKITPGRRIHSYGLGVPLLQVIRDPVSAGRVVTW